MYQYRINGGKRLEGEVTIEGSKNAVLPILAATLIHAGTSIIHNYPALRDVHFMLEIIRSLGCQVTVDALTDTVVIDATNMNSDEILQKSALEMRSSIIFLGAVLARMGSIRITHPGGCELGPRPVDLHIKALRQMGAELEDVHNGMIQAQKVKLVGTEIHLHYPSVGATENIMIAAVRAKGQTVIRNAAKEPEIIDLQNFLNAMGGKVMGAGTGTILVVGVEQLHDVEYTVIPDRIVAGTYMAAATVTGGDLYLKQVIPEHIAPVMAALRECGTALTVEADGVRVVGPKRPKAPEIIRTLPHPGFPTDMQAPMVSVMAVAEGTGIMIETVFESRYKHVDELTKMGANIKVDGRIAVVRGVPKLHGTQVRAGDLRGGAALLVAGLAAEGTTVVLDEKHIERGYVEIERKLQAVGADIIKEE